MPHIHTLPGQHDHTVSAFIVVLDNNQHKLLLHRHKKLGTFMQFGGHIELDENPWQAILREITEESGYVADQLEVLQPPKSLQNATGIKIHPVPFCYNTHTIAGEVQHLHTDASYVFVTEQQPKKSHAEYESKDVVLFSKSEIQQMPEKDIQPNIREIANHILDSIMFGWEKIPTQKYNI